MIQTTTELYSILNSSEKEIKNIIDHIAEHYKRHTQPKIKYGKYQIDNKGTLRLRHLLIPSEALKKIQQKINCYLQQIPLPVYMYGCIRGKSHIKNASHHLSQKYFLTADLKNFFSNIDHQNVFQLFRRYNFSVEVSRILTKLTTYKRSLPQGAPCSPTIANLVFLPVAEQLNTMANHSGIRFSCFLDDLSFSSQYPFKNLVPEILDIIKLNGFFPSQNKIHYCVGKCEITGLIVCNSTLNVIATMRKESKTNAKLRTYVQSIDRLNNN